MAAKKQAQQPASQFTPTTMALMAMTLIVGILVGFLVGKGTKEADGDGPTTSAATTTTTRAEGSAATTKNTGKSKAAMPAGAARSDSPFLDADAVAKFEGLDAELADYRRAVDFVDRRNFRGAGPVLDKLAGDPGAVYMEEVGLLLAANKVNQNLPQEALDALEGWRASYPDSRLMAHAALVEGKAHIAFARGKAGGRGAGTTGAGADEYRKAAEVFEGIGDKYADDAVACGEALYNLGAIYKNLGDDERSLSMYDQLVERYPTHPLAARALYQVGNSAWGAEDYDTAKSYFQKLVDQYADDSLSKRARKNITALGIIGQDAPELVVDHWFGTETTVAASRGKVVLLAYWNEWCPHCRREMPKLQKLHEKYSDQGLVVIAVTKHTKGQTDEKIQQFLDSNGITFPCAVEPAGYPSTKDYGVSGVPAGAVIDKTGRIAWRNHPARLTEERLVQFLGG